MGSGGSHCNGRVEIVDEGFEIVGITGKCVKGGENFGIRNHRVIHAALLVSVWIYPPTQKKMPVRTFSTGVIQGITINGKDVLLGYGLSILE
jgi:hypothetical protein